MMGANMSFWTILLFAVALGMDAFSMAVSVGMRGISTAKGGQISLTVAILHIVLPLVGIYLGGVLGSVAGNIASYIGAAVLIFLGAKMIYEEFRPGEPDELNGNEGNGRVAVNSISGWQLIVLPVSVSIDSLSIGFSLGTFGVTKMLLITGTFGLVAGVMTIAGLLLGVWAGHMFNKTSIVGGGILLILGFKMLFS